MYAVITGASSGIGRQIAIDLAKRGYDLIVVARRKNRLIRLKQILSDKYNVKVIIKVLDISKEENCYSLMESIQKLPVNILVNNAGFGSVGNAANTPIYTDVEMIKTNIVALHILTRLFVEQRETGYILNVASLAGFAPDPLMASYGSSKSYVINYSLALNYELKKMKKNISITTLCPGPVKTEFNKVAKGKERTFAILAKECAVCGTNAMFARKSIAVPGNKLSIFAKIYRAMPYSVSLPATYYMQKTKQNWLFGDSCG